MSHTVTTPDGTITVTDAALERLVVLAAEHVEGARVRRPRRGLELALEDGRARVDVELAVRFGAVVPDVARAVQEAVAGALRGSCGLEVDAVDVRVEELDL